MTILLLLKQRNYVRVFMPAIRELAARGHHVRLLWPDEDASVPDGLRDCPHIEVHCVASARTDEWRVATSLLRRAADYLRYLAPVYRGARKLRGRAFTKLVGTLTGLEVQDEWSERALALNPAEVQRLESVCRLIEDAVPSDPGIERLLAAHRPDMLLVSPAIDLGSNQSDFLKSADRLGIPTGVLVYSWDNLSTKGRLHVAPGRLFVSRAPHASMSSSTSSQPPREPASVSRLASTRRRRR